MAMYNWLPESKFKTFFTVIAIVFIAYLLRAVFYYIVTYFGHSFGVTVEGDMRKDLFFHVQDLSFSFFDNNRTGVLMSRITHDLFEIMELAHHGPENILISSLTIIGALTVLYTINWKLSLILTIILPILVIFVYKIGQMDMDKSVEVKVSLGKINSSIESALSGMRTAKAFSNEEIEKEKFTQATEDYKYSKRDYYKVMGVFMSGTEFIYAFMPLVVLFTGGIFIKHGELNYIDLITFMLYINTFVTPLKKISNMAETFANGLAGLERFNELMEIKPIVTDPECPKCLSIKNGDIKLDNVYFSYKENDEILHGLSLDIKGGETIAIVGSSGGGKTTLCQLLPRFYDVTSGSILIDDIDVRDVLQKDLRNKIGIVQQDVFLFADTIMENIRYGKPDASDEEVIEAAKKAELFDDIMAMPDKFNTYTGERGVMLSGGQKQRVAIARIFLKNPPILILDEATSALDSITESTIQNAFDELSKGRTTLIIAHRLSTIKKANTIVVIDNGEIKEKGTHAELIAHNGIYAKLYNTQMAI